VSGELPAVAQAGEAGARPGKRSPAAEAGARPGGIWGSALTTQEWPGNAEGGRLTELVNGARHDARRALEGDVRRLGAEGVVIAGSAVTRFARPGHRRAGPALTVMPLGRPSRHGLDIGGTSRAL
jgi:hypothetical protein